MGVATIHPGPFPVLSQSDLSRPDIDSIGVQKGNDSMQTGAIANFPDDLREIPVDALKLVIFTEMTQREFMAKAAFRP